MVVAGALERIAEDAARGDLVFSTHAEIVLGVQKALDDPDCAIDKLARMISAEPMLSTRVVAVANSVAYRRSGPATSDVKSAVGRLGFRTVRTLAAAVLIRQMRDRATTPEHRKLAHELWEHSAHVAALARVIAQRIVRKDPETAFFAGIVHEAGGFYLISRAASFPGLLEKGLAEWDGDGEALVGGAVLRELEVPDPVLEATEELWEGYLRYPPATLGDALLLAEHLSPVESPLSRLGGNGHGDTHADIDVALDEDTLKHILAESAAEVASLVEALDF
jgi:HD-like signal output (HDOD) protein